MQRLIEAGGEIYGQMTEKYFKGIGHLKVVYARDIDGNIIEIQNWAEKTSQ